MTPSESIRKQLEQLSLLVTLDAELQRVDKELSAAKESLAKKEAERDALAARLRSERASFEDLTKQLQLLHQDARQLREQMSRSRDKLNRVRNERDVVAVERELDELRRLLRDREDEINKLESLSATAKTSIASAETELLSLETDLAESGPAERARISELEAERAKRADERASVANTLPALVIRRYDAAQKRRGTGIAVVSKAGLCTACHVSISPQLFQRIQRHEVLEPCPSCSRLLVYPLESVAIDPVTGRTESLSS